MKKIIVGAKRMSVRWQIDAEAQYSVKSLILNHFILPVCGPLQDKEIQTTFVHSSSFISFEKALSNFNF